MWKSLAAALVVATLLMPVKASALENEDLLSLVAMPLAVAAVSEIAGVPVNDLIDVVTMLNTAAVPPPQFIEVIRYVPVALVTEENDFVEFVRVREQEGLRGTVLVNSIAERLRIYGLPDVDLAVTRPRTIDVVEDEFVPPPVRLRLAEIKRHPHGGPPGQLKKAASTRVVSQVVDDDRVAKARRDDKPERKIRPRKVRTDKRIATRDAARADRAPAAKQARKSRGNDRGNNGGGRGQGNEGEGKGGNGKGKGKG